MDKREVASVYLAALVQGVTLVAFPAASTIFISAEGFNLSSAAYGSLFVPQSIISIAASFLSTGLAQRKGIKFVFLVGLAANLLSMALLAGSSFFMSWQSMAYGILLLATSSLGLGFGLTVPSLNTFAALFFPKKADSAILALNALLGLGTALAPVLIAIFVGFGIWWGLPSLLLFAILGLLFFTFPLPLLEGRSAERRQSHQSLFSMPMRFWLFAAFALIYGFVETVNGNWATVYMSKQVKVSIAAASFALTFFWTMVTIFRIFFASIAKFFPPKHAFRMLPFVTAVAFILIASLPSGSPFLGALAFGFAGVGCSALLPLTISLAGKELISVTASAAGSMIAFYLLGYGIAAYGVGLLYEMLNLSLMTIFALCSIVALALGVLAFIVTRDQSVQKI